jgi:hypothetical protein
MVISVNAVVIPPAASNLLNAFRLRVTLANVVQTLHAHRDHLQQEAAGPAGHVDAGAPEQTAAVLSGCVVNARVLRDQPRRQMVIGVRGRPCLSYVEPVSAAAMA